MQHPAVPFEPPLERGPLELGTLVTDSLSCLSETASFSRRARSFRVFEGNRGARAPEEVRLHLLRLFLSVSSKFLVQSGGGDALAFNTPKKVQYYKILQ